MRWANFLHIYQPHNQQSDILERIVNESYRPLLDGFKKNKKARLTLNVNGGLLELLEQNGYDDVIDDIGYLLRRGQIELTGSAMYHPFLPLLPEKEIKRQINLHNQTCQKYFGKNYQPKGFFSPELAFSYKLANLVSQLGFQWIVAEEFASSIKPDFQKIYSIKNIPSLKIVFRDKRISVLILSAIIRSKASLLAELGEELKKNRYLLTVMDGETFGHHRPGLEKFLFNLYQEAPFKNVLVSELVEEFSVDEEIEVRESTWSSEEQDFWLDKEKKQGTFSPFLLWQDPSNPTHKLQWDFTYFVIDLVEKAERENQPLGKARELLDKSLQSDQFWWASAKPWWSLEMIEQGAYQLREVVNALPNASLKEKEKANEYYQKILAIAFDWQRKGIIRHRYRQALGTENKKPFKERVSKEWYNLIILELEDEMKKAAANLEFEKAIKWRDALEKLKQGTDIYDVLHIIDDLRASRTLPSLKSFWEHSLDEFSPLAENYFKDFNKDKFQEEQFLTLFSKIKAVIDKKDKQSHPLGAFWDKYNNFYLAEFPGKEIKFYLREGWNSCSKIEFDKKEKVHSFGQLTYRLKKGNKLEIIFEKNSLLAKVLDYLKKRDKLKGKYLKVAVVSQTLGWLPRFFKEDKEGQLKVEIPCSKEGVLFKFKITGYNLSREKKIKFNFKKPLIIILSKIDALLQRLIWFLTS